MSALMSGVTTVPVADLEKSGIPTNRDWVSYFTERITPTPSGCWEWNLARDDLGYGFSSCRFYRSQKSSKWRAHRLAWSVFVGPIPADLTIHHRCFNPPCVNPEHMELMTSRQNAATNKNSLKTHCPEGHEYTPENTSVLPGNKPGLVRRECITCRRARQRRYDAKRRAS